LQKIVFLHSVGMKGMGSKIMRCDQLAHLANYYLGDQFTFEVRAAPYAPESVPLFISDMKDSVIIVLKNTLGRMESDVRKKLKDSARAMCVDWVDVPPDVETKEYFDVHIAASYSGLDQIDQFIKYHKDSLKPCVSGQLVRHGYDPMVDEYSDQERQNSQLKLVYFGSLKSTICPERIKEKISWLTYDQRNAKSGFAELLTFDMQYAVRPRMTENFGRRRIHPFTKGMMAAALKQNILVDRGAPDALHFLGEDYPYLLADNSEVSIQAGVQYAYDSYGGAEWKYGLEIMEHVATQCTPEIIVADLKKAIETAMQTTM
jgi:hypothetical protein